MNAAWKWSISFVLTTLAVVVSYHWLDRPIALFAHDRIKQYNLFESLTYIPKIVTPLALLGFAVIGLYALLGRPLTKLHMVAVLCAASVAVTEAIKFQLKFAFGRTWPETWVRNNPSFIRDNVYGFFPFHGDPGFAAFPSGHTAAVCAVMSVLRAAWRDPAHRRGLLAHQSRMDAGRRRRDQARRQRMVGEA